MERSKKQKMHKISRIYRYSHVVISLKGVSNRNFGLPNIATRKVSSYNHHVLIRKLRNKIEESLPNRKTVYATTIAQTLGQNKFT